MLSDAHRFRWGKALGAVTLLRCGRKRKMDRRKFGKAGKIVAGIENGTKAVE
jgi:hypothetical protein